MGQRSVRPAKVSPKPTKPERPSQNGWSVTPRAVPRITKRPAARRTWRSSDQRVLTCTTRGRPALAQALVPPSSTVTSCLHCSSKPAARRARVPLWQINTIGELACTSSKRASSWSSGILMAPGTCPAAYSVAERTSTHCPRTSRCIANSPVVISFIFTPLYGRALRSRKGFRRTDPSNTPFGPVLSYSSGGTVASFMLTVPFATLPCIRGSRPQKLRKA